MSNIMVSVCVLSYNHEKYLRDCLEGIVMQRTTFSIEAWVHDDASTDSSQKIIKEYQQRYPDIIKPILQTENQYSKHEGSILQNHVYPHCTGKYIAICEGDDYWTDPLKLQKQVDILESDETAIACVTNVSVVDNTGRVLEPIRLREVVHDNVSGKYTLRDFFEYNHQYPTLTVVYRNIHQEEIAHMMKHMENPFMGDWIRWIALHIFGDFYFLNEVTAAYRINPTSVTHTVNRVARAKATKDICLKVADILPDEYADIAADLRDTGWTWIPLMHAYKVEKRYLEMMGCLLMACFICPKSLWNAIR